MGSGLRLKLNGIPEQYRRLIACDKALDLDVDIGERHGISSGKQAQKTKKIMAGLFLKEIRVGDLMPVLQRELALPIEKAKLLALDIAGLRLLAVNDWLGGDIPDYIRSLGGKIEDYSKIIQETKKSADEDDEFYKTTKENDIEEKIEGRIIDDPSVLAAKDEASFVFDLKKEKDDSEKNLKESLLELLDPKNEDIAEDYNDILLQLLMEGGAAAKNDLEKALSANQERLTSSPFMLDGKVSSGTVANWIKYFIATKGSDAFDNISLSSFLVQSPNAKVLNEKEKTRLRKLLTLYRNLKFFPDSMPNKTGDGWEIIPTQIADDVQRETKVVKEKEVSESEKKVQDLRLVLAKYPEGSLARRAVEEEIKRLKNPKS